MRALSQNPVKVLELNIILSLKLESGNFVLADPNEVIRCY
jgi:hypothetical protein